MTHLSATKFRVTYPLITQDGQRDFDTLEEAERFATERRNICSTSQYMTGNSWRHVRVAAVANERVV